MNTKQIILIALGILALTLLPLQLAHAQERDAIGIGVRLSYNSISDDSAYWGPPWPAQTTEYDGALLAELTLTVPLSKGFSADFSAGYSLTDLDVSSGGGGVRFAEIQQLSVLASLRFHLIENEYVTVRAGAGLGFYTFELDRYDDLGDFFSAAPVDVEPYADDAVGFHLAIGFEYWLSEKVSFGMDVRYVFLETDLGFKGTGGDRNDASNMDALVGGVGLTYYP